MASMAFAAFGIALAWVDPWISYAIYSIAPLSFAWLQFV
jgi:hypothetical protein